MAGVRDGTRGDTVNEERDVEHVLARGFQLAEEMYEAQAIAEELDGNG